MANNRLYRIGGKVNKRLHRAQPKELKYMDNKPYGMGEEQHTTQWPTRPLYPHFGVVENWSLYTTNYDQEEIFGSVTWSPGQGTIPIGHEAYEPYEPIANVVPYTGTCRTEWNTEFDYGDWWCDGSLWGCVHSLCSYESGGGTYMHQDGVERGCPPGTHPVYQYLQHYDMENNYLLLGKWDTWGTNEPNGFGHQETVMGYGGVSNSTAFIGIAFCAFSHPYDGTIPLWRYHQGAHGPGTYCADNQSCSNNSYIATYKHVHDFNTDGTPSQYYSMGEQIQNIGSTENPQPDWSPLFPGSINSVHGYGNACCTYDYDGILGYACPKGEPDCMKSLIDQEAGPPIRTQRGGMMPEYGHGGMMSTNTEKKNNICPKGYTMSEAGVCKKGKGHKGINLGGSGKSGNVISAVSGESQPPQTMIDFGGDCHSACEVGQMQCDGLIGGVQPGNIGWCNCSPISTGVGPGSYNTNSMQLTGGANISLVSGVGSADELLDFAADMQGGWEAQLAAALWDPATEAWMSPVLNTFNLPSNWSVNITGPVSWQYDGGQMYNTVGTVFQIQTGLASCNFQYHACCQYWWEQEAMQSIKHVSQQQSEAPIRFNRGGKTTVNKYGRQKPMHSKGNIRRNNIINKKGISSINNFGGNGEDNIMGGGSGGGSLYDMDPVYEYYSGNYLDHLYTLNGEWGGSFGQYSSWGSQPLNDGNPVFHVVHYPGDCKTGMAPDYNGWMDNCSPSSNQCRIEDCSYAGECPGDTVPLCAWHNSEDGNTGGGHLNHWLTTRYCTLEHGNYPGQGSYQGIIGCVWQSKFQENAPIFNYTNQGYAGFKDNYLSMYGPSTLTAPNIDYNGPTLIDLFGHNEIYGTSVGSVCPSGIYSAYTTDDPNSPSGFGCDSGVNWWAERLEGFACPWTNPTCVQGTDIESGPPIRTQRGGRMPKRSKIKKY